MFNSSIESSKFVRSNVCDLETNEPMKIIHLSEKFVFHPFSLILNLFDLIIHRDIMDFSVNILYSWL